MAKVAFILSGCGVYDGAEIHESVIAMLALSQHKHTYQCFAPDIEQKRVVDHLAGEAIDEKRNCLVEAARIARGKISPLSKLDIESFDAIFLPGGFGVAINLSDFAGKQADCEVLPEMKEIVLAFHKAKKPILATCITPAILGKIFEGVASVTLTLGSDPSNAKMLEGLGMKAEILSVNQAAFDEENLVYTTPCYMETATLPELYEGITKIVQKLGPAAQ